MEKEYDQFIGLYKNAVPDELCDRFIEWFDLIKEGNISASSLEDAPHLDGKMRKDEVIQIPSGLNKEYFPSKWCLEEVWPCLNECYDHYKKEYNIDFSVMSNNFKMHRAVPTQGYHVWHSEHSQKNPERVAVWMICINAAEEGGETEFLMQSKRVKLEKGCILIWPAGYTHKHRGNPPLKGEKYYITGWFDHTAM